MTLPVLMHAQAVHLGSERGALSRLQVHSQEILEQL